jgi:hypothetical protein
MNSSLEKFRSVFVDLVHALISSLSEVFPECAQTREQLQAFEKIRGTGDMEEKLIHDCRRAFQQCLGGDEAMVLNSIDIFKTIGILEKWNDPEFTDESRRHLCHYVHAMDAFSHIYTCLPRNLLGRAEHFAKVAQQTAQETAQQIARHGTPKAAPKVAPKVAPKAAPKAASNGGGGKAKRAGDLQTIGAALYGELTTEERQALERSLPELMNCACKIGRLVQDQCNEGVSMEALLSKFGLCVGSSDCNNLLSLAQSAMSLFGQTTQPSSSLGQLS